MTTVVFPNADYKFYLDASLDVQAQRRFDQGVSNMTLEEIKEAIRKRDEIDRNKAEGALKRAPDAVYIDTSRLTIDNVCEIILNKIHRKGFTMEEMEVEKEETQKMMAELLAMKAQMEANGKVPAQTAEPAPEAVEERKENPNAERIATMKKDLEEVEKNLTELTGAKNALGAIGESTPEIEAKIAQISLTIEKLATVKEQISGEISRLEG